MNEKLCHFGKMVDNHEQHAWRQHSLKASIEVQPVMHVNRVNVYGNIDLVVQRGSTAVIVAGHNEKAVRTINPALVLGTLHFRQVASKPSLHHTLWPFRILKCNHPPKVVIALTLPFIPVIQHYGTGDVYIYDVDQTDLMLGMLGTGRVQAHGRVSGLAASLTGEGEMDLSALSCGMALTTLSGKGLIKVQAENRLTARISGEGHIIVHGSSPVVDSTVTGTGSVKSIPPG